MREVEFIKNTMAKTSDPYEKFLIEEEAEKALAYHKSFDEYEKTPLVHLDMLAERLGLASLCIKDESYRFGLNAFKVLGSSYAVGNIYAREKGLSQISFENLSSKEAREYFENLTLYTATDGNHGRGLAWTANRLGAKAVVRMPKATCKERLLNIKKLGADVTIEDKTYDECVAMAYDECIKDENGIFVQDTALPGYEEIPTWIMQGYLTMCKEAGDDLKEEPTHIFIQAGVGSLAGAVAGYFTARFKNAKVIVMEPFGAPCHFESAKNKEITKTEGDLVTIMAGLACGEPNPISWDILTNHAFGFVVCSDEISALGMRILSAPLRGDKRVICGESAGIGTGLIYKLMTDESLEDVKRQMELSLKSRVLLISTEGDTNKEGYEKIVWQGKY